jgi:hypothetical protein
MPSSVTTPQRGDEAFEERRRKLLLRKVENGRSCSYRQLSSYSDRSPNTLRHVLMDEEMDFVSNRWEILNVIERALEAYEEEHLSE